MPESSKEIEEIIHGKCAIVSGSSSLLNSNLGNIIDSYDTVVRMNVNPTIGYEKDVGSKTSIRAMSGVVAGGFFSKDFELYKDIILDPTLKAFWLVFNEGNVGEVDLSNSNGLYEVGLKQLLNVSKFRENEQNPKKVFFSNFRIISTLTTCIAAMNPWRYDKQFKNQAAFEDYEDEFSIRTKLMPTSGFRALLGIIPYCDSIDLFGFERGFDSHYFTNLTISKRYHHLEAERDYIDVLASMNIINLYKKNTLK
eukprot:TRINITY_DN2987_c0_g1_i2.p1 TRINITY_DN2987_c0_g1~~TRINITY_DN2987_c0_g1_i2.p1  ORF type:complete len:253 (-),score=108.26 TRINITY_DN2987_c0_g1_i2:65-823(-)